MRRLTTISLLAVLCSLYVSNTATANNLPPTAVITPNFSGSQIYNGEMAIFSAANSYDNDEGGDSITSYRWAVRVGSGSYVTKKYGGGSTYQTYTICFDLDATSHSPTPDGCMGTSGNSSVTIRLEVWDDEGSKSSYTYKSLTVIDRANRKYFIKDHLGSIRSTIDQNGDVIGYDDYYPFGLGMPGRSNNTSNPNDTYKFTGAELDTEGNLGIYHMNARGMDPVTGRFLQLDPMQEFASPYVYAGNNPVSLTDPTGMSTECNEGEKEEDCRARQHQENVEEDNQRANQDAQMLGAGWAMGSTAGRNRIKNNSKKEEQQTGYNTDYDISIDERFFDDPTGDYHSDQQKEDMMRMLEVYGDRIKKLFGKGGRFENVDVTFEFEAYPLELSRNLNGNSGVATYGKKGTPVSEFYSSLKARFVDFGIDELALFVYISPNNSEGTQAKSTPMHELAHVLLIASHVAFPSHPIPVGNPNQHNIIGKTPVTFLDDYFEALNY
ncbi:MAG: RHS repeat-associated core domain-containing protein [Balneolaceae bacterium]|nr:RHS repeat-associated core domain-containing protein [Balneolaceae bacterium]MBO6547121.1 RHS repeat-associated core domain-containing protein [Balneolaceae bacterium]MBO6647932.1 RHS repeat-associated core domain-containing protein [Balneolaceae bacterium]